MRSQNSRVNDGGSVKHYITLLQGNKTRFRYILEEETDDETILTPKSSFQESQTKQPVSHAKLPPRLDNQAEESNGCSLLRYVPKDVFSWMAHNTTPQLKKTTSENE